MTYPFSKSINYDKLSTYPELSASIKHNFSPNKHANLIHLKSKQNSTVDFTFKYTSEQHLASVVKHVRRRRQHEQDEEEWKLFYKKKQMEEEIEEQKQLFKNNTDIDEDGSLVPELVIDTSEIVNEQDRSGNMCKCIQSEVVNDIKCLHINDDIVSEGSDQCITKQRILGLSHQPPTNGHNCMYPVKTHEAKLVDHHLLNYITESNRRISEVSEPLSMGVLKKMEDLVTYINKIGMILTTSQNESVDSDVAERNLKRNTEFTTLFARNYLYRVQRQKKEAKKIFVGGFPLPQQKLATMYQTALQALQVYERHLLKSCIHKKCMQQLEQIFDFIIYLITLTEKVTGGENFLHKHELIDGSKQLKCILFERAKVETNIMSSTVVKKQVSKPLKTKRKTQDKLSMYVSNQTKPFWKKSSAKLAKLKFGPPSAHKSHEHKKGREISVPNLSGKKSKETEPNETKVTFEKLDNIQERELQNKNVENEITLKKSFRKATRAVPEEEVVTMMEILKHQFNDETDEDENIQPLTTTLKEDSVKVFPNGAEVLLQNVSREQLRDEVENSGDQKSMVSGKINSNTLWPKNIQMVCIKAEELKNKDINISVPSNPGVKDNSNEPKNQTIHRLLVSNSDRDIALGYKKNCSAFAESFQAYEDDNKPWDIVSRISDEVTLDVLESVCQTLEIDIVIQKLYDLEFR